MLARQALAIGDPSSLRFPRRLDYVAVRIAALDADIFGLIPLLDQLDAIGGKPVAQREHRVAVRHSDPEVHPRRAGNRLLAATERERKARGVVQHEYAVVIASRRPRAKAKVGLVETARALLITHLDSEVIHRDDGTTYDLTPPLPCATTNTRRRCVSSERRSGDECSLSRKATA